MSRSRWAARGLALSLLLAALGGWRVADAKSRRVEEGLAIGLHPPRFAAQDLSGTRHTLQQYEGTIVVLHFWASWCPVCRGEIPKLADLYQRASRHDLTVLTVSVDQDLAQLKAFVERARLPYPIIPDSQLTPSVADRYGIHGIPVTYVLARDGRIAARFIGSADLIPAVQYLLAQASAPAAS